MNIQHQHQHQQQSRVGSIHPVSSISESASVTRTVHAGFILGSPLPAPHNPGYRAGFIAGFVAYSKTVTTHVSIHASYRFSVSAHARPWTSDPVRALLERTREHPAGAMLFETYQFTTVSILYFSYACVQTSARSQGVAPPPKPMPTQTPRQLPAGNAPAAAAAPSFNPVPQAANMPAPAPVPPSSAPATERPGATVSLKPVELSKPSKSSDWVKLPDNQQLKNRFEVWEALGKKKRTQISFSLRTSPEVRKTVTPLEIVEEGAAFRAVDTNGKVETIPFSAVNSVDVLSA
jgi:hypothetical protein